MYLYVNGRFRTTPSFGYARLEAAKAPVSTPVEAILVNRCDLRREWRQFHRRPHRGGYGWVLLPIISVAPRASNVVTVPDLPDLFAIGDT